MFEAVLLYQGATLELHIGSLSRHILHDFQARKAVNERYSLRSYARYLGLNPTSLSLYLRGKRGLSAKARLKVVTKLKESNPQVEFLLSEKGQYTELDLEKLSVVGDWWHFAILSLCELQDFKSSPKWIASRLNIPVSDARKAIESLLKLGLLELGPEKRLAVTGRSFATPDQISSMAIRRSHFQALDLARRSLEQDSLHKRSFVAMTMAIDPTRLATAHKRMRKFNRRLCEFLEGGEKKEVYRMAMQLFPLSRSPDVSS